MHEHVRKTRKHTNAESQTIVSAPVQQAMPPAPVDRAGAVPEQTPVAPEMGTAAAPELAADAALALSDRARPSAGHRFDDVRVHAGTQHAPPAAPVQRRATSMAVQRDGPLTLQTPSLLQEPDPAARFRLGGEYQLHLDPEIQLMARRYIEQQLDPAALRPALSRLSLGGPGTPGTGGVPGLPGQTGGATQTAGGAGGATPAPNPVTGPPTTPPAPLVPAGEGPNTPQPASVGDLASAIMAVPAIDQALTNLKTQATDRVQRDWGRLGTGEKVGVVSTVAVIGIGTLAGVASDPAARRFALDQLNGRVLPVPGVNWLHVELNTGGNNVMVGMHLDVGRLLPPSWGFGAGSPSAIGGPPQPEPFVPGQRSADRTSPRERPDEESREGGATLAQRITAASPSGDRLTPDVQYRLESALDADLAGVRVHTGGEADRLARSVDAVAFTTGRDIFFRAGAYAPSSAEGFTLLAHEATHTVQQAAGAVAGTPTAGGVSLSHPSDPYERAAERAAATAAERDPARRGLEATPDAHAPIGHDFGRLPVHPSPAAPDGASFPAQRVRVQVGGSAPVVPWVQRKPGTAAANTSDTAHVGGEEGSMTFLPGPGDETFAPGEAGYSRRMLAETGAAAEKFEGYQEARLVNVAPSFGVLDRQIKKRGDEVAYFKDKSEEFGNLPSTVKLWQRAQTWCQEHGQQLEGHRASEEEKIAGYNAWVPRANGFFTSLTRLDAMQDMLGVKDPNAMASALTKGLSDAQAVGERLQKAHDAGKAETLDVPAVDDSIADASTATTQAAKEMNTAYLGFQKNSLKERAAAVNEEGAADRDRLEKINEVKKFVRDVGKTVDVTMSVVSGAPAAISNATTAMQRAGASVNAIRNQRLIRAGQAPRHNPTYVTVDDKGNMIVRNVQTGMDRPIEGGEQTASPESQGIKLPTSVSDLLGTIADFAYAAEVREINMRLEAIKSRCSMINGVIELNEIRAAAQNFQDKLNAFAIKCNELQKKMQERRQKYLEFGVQLDNFARRDAASRSAGQAPGAGGERYATIMTVVSQVREVLASGNGAAGGFDSPMAVAHWAQDIDAVRTKRRPRSDIEAFTLPDSEWKPLEKMYGQVKTFHSNVGQLQGIFANVETQARQLIGALHQGSGGAGGAY